MNINVHMSKLAKDILRDEKARKQLDDIIYKKGENKDNKSQYVEYNNSKYKVEFVDK